MKEELYEFAKKQRLVSVGGQNGECEASRVLGHLQGGASEAAILYREQEIVNVARYFIKYEKPEVIADFGGDDGGAGFMVEADAMATFEEQDLNGMVEEVAPAVEDEADDDEVDDEEDGYATEEIEDVAALEAVGADLLSADKCQHDFFRYIANEVFDYAASLLRADMLLERDCEGKTPLIIAAKSYSCPDTLLESICHLLRYKTDPAKRRKILNARDERGRTALHYFAAYGKAEYVQKLLELGADVNASDELGLTPYDYTNLSAEQLRDILRSIIINGDRNVKADSNFDSHTANFFDTIGHDIDWRIVRVPDYFRLVGLDTLVGNSVEVLKVARNKIACLTVDKFPQFGSRSLSEDDLAGYKRIYLHRLDEKIEAFSRFNISIIDRCLHDRCVSRNILFDYDGKESGCDISSLVPFVHEGNREALESRVDYYSISRSIRDCIISDHIQLFDHEKLTRAWVEEAAQAEKAAQFSVVGSMPG